MSLTSNTLDRRRIAVPVAEIIPALTTLCVFCVLAAGWVASREEPFTPKSGVGYWLGIAGASMMGLLFVYYVRKRVNPGPRSARSIPAWFRFHVILGIVGPVLILFHCNFRLGAFNSNVALFSMTAVVISGAVGRYLYRFAYWSGIAVLERVFGAWRILHAPLCVVLAISAIVHIWAVHRF